MIKLPLLQDAPLYSGTRVLLRVDFDVRIMQGSIEDDFRMRTIIPTINFLHKKKSRIRIIAHRDRPEGVRKFSLSMKHLVTQCEKMLGQRVIFVADPFSKDAFKTYNTASEIVLFENIRFWKGEEENTISFAKALARWGDCYVNDAFANAHRAHASVETLPKLLPSFAGLYLQKEIEFLEQLLHNPPRPYVALLGGAKLETKMRLVSRLLQEADTILIGGALANAIFSLYGYETGRSSPDHYALKNMRADMFADKKIILPEDFVVVRSRRDPFDAMLRRYDRVEKKDFINDVGPKTIRRFNEILKSAKTICWNGPVGLAEIPEFSTGTKKLAKIIQKIHAFKVVGGGDTISLLHRYNLLSGFTHVSTGGGALLAYLAGETLPALRALTKNNPNN